MSKLQSEKLKLRWQDPEYRKKMSLAHKGKKPKNLEALIALSRSPEGRKASSERNKGRKAWNKGKGKFDARGYTVLSATNQREHRAVMEKHIGRKLKKQEVVHHCDEDKKNNKLDNLNIFRHQSAHLRLHWFARRHNISMKSLKFNQSWLINQ